ncbi:putative membrane protein [Paenibacillus larvae subsp. larvae DSM 25430]|nr:putative membrane protein [Paenibacillus larvae subsp. larvae DSM 25430]PCK72412.1 hypothetical protein PL1_0001 [Paenibacillus larvae subsp. larvae B-3650]
MITSEDKEGCRMKFKPLWRHFREMKHYFIATTLVFVVGIFLGAVYNQQFYDFLAAQTKGMKDLVNKINSQETPQIWFFVVIFLNNSIKALLFIFSGLFFGLLPLFSMISNGLLLGFLISRTPASDVFEMVAKGILPHGIIELPAIIIASAYGLKLGGLVFKGMFSLFRPAALSNVKKELIQVLKLTGPLAVVLVGALFIAAIIESTLTFWLAQG